MDKTNQIREIRKQIDKVRALIAENELNKMGYELDVSEAGLGVISIRKING